MLSDGKGYLERKHALFSEVRISNKEIADAREESLQISLENVFNYFVSYQPVKLYEKIIFAQRDNRWLVNDLWHTSVSAWGVKYVPDTLNIIGNKARIFKIRYPLKSDLNHSLKLSGSYVRGQIDYNKDGIFDELDVQDIPYDTTIWMITDVNNNDVSDVPFAYKIGGDWRIAVDMDCNSTNIPLSNLSVDAIDYNNDGILDKMDVDGDGLFNKPVQFLSFFMVKSASDPQDREYFEASELLQVLSQFPGAIFCLVFDCYSGKIHRYNNNPNILTFSSCGSNETVFGQIALDKLTNSLNGVANNQNAVWFDVFNISQESFLQLRPTPMTSFYLKDGINQIVALKEFDDELGSDEVGYLLSQTMLHNPEFIRQPNYVRGNSRKDQFFQLKHNYPNPFNPETSIQFNLPINSKVDLYIYNAVGQRIRTLVSARMSAGTHTVIWNGRNDLGQKVASGVYFYSIKAGNFSKTMKMFMMK